LSQNNTTLESARNYVDIDNQYFMATNLKYSFITRFYGHLEDILEQTNPFWFAVKLFIVSTAKTFDKPAGNVIYLIEIG